MKIACIGNMNNNAFSIARYLRDRGFDADVLLLNDEVGHFHPSADTYNLEYQKYTHNLSWGSPFGFLTADKKQISSDLKEYDFIIACGSVPAFMDKIGRSIDIFVPYGKDLYLYPFFKLTNPKYQLSYSLFNKSQRTGIRNAAYLNWDTTNKETEEILSRLKHKGKRLTYGIPAVYSPQYNPVSIKNYYDRSHWYREFEQIRKNHELVIFHHARHIWKNSPDQFSWKANDKLFRGFAEFLKQSENVNACIVTCDFGIDVNETKKLIRDLGIESHVRWFPQMPRKDIMIGLSLADIGTGEFHMSWLSCGTIYETLAMAKPVMHFREDHLYKAQYPELYPLINVKTPLDITAALHDYVARPEFYAEIGERGRQWFQRFAIDNAINEFARIIEGRKNPGEQCKTNMAGHMR